MTRSLVVRRAADVKASQLVERVAMQFGLALQCFNNVIQVYGQRLRDGFSKVRGYRIC